MTSDIPIKYGAPTKEELAEMICLNGDEVPDNECVFEEDADTKSKRKKNSRKKPPAQ